MPPPDPMTPLEALLAVVESRPDPASWTTALAALVPADVPGLEIPRDGWNSEQIAGSPSWDLTLFTIPAGEAIPLHDHPGMHVLTHVLRGSLLLERWDLPQPHQPALATPKPALTVGPESAPHLTTPTADNVHGITALEDTLFLDLFSPYYDPPQRACTYYRVVDGQTLVRAGSAHPE